MADMMMFPDTVEEFMEQYKMVDKEQIYSNGIEYVPIFRMKQWFEHVSDTDTISRQAAIDAINHICPVDTEYDCTLLDRVDARCVLSDLPSAQPEPPWIPCSEKMPEEHEWIGTKKFGTTISDEVYVTFENEKGERFCKHMTFQNGELSRYDKAYMEAWYNGSKPIAWMPLPKPFEGGIK